MTITKLNNSTFKIARGTREETLTISQVLEQKSLLEAKLVNFDLRVATDRAALVARIDAVDQTISDAIAAGVQLP